MKPKPPSAASGRVQANPEFKFEVIEIGIRFQVNLGSISRDRAQRLLAEHFARPENRPSEGTYWVFLGSKAVRPRQHITGATTFAMRLSAVFGVIVTADSSRADIIMLVLPKIKQEFLDRVDRQVRSDQGVAFVIPLLDIVQVKVLGRIDHRLLPVLQSNFVGFRTELGQRISCPVLERLAASFDPTGASYPNVPLWSCLAL